MSSKTSSASFPHIQKAKPDICVVIPNYNGAQFITRAINSALVSTGLNAQVVVVDDASSDASVSLAEDFGDRITLRRLETNAGANSARNAGLEACAADFVLFLDSDDFLEPGGLPVPLNDFKLFPYDAYIGSFKYASAESEWKRRTASKLEICDGNETAWRWVDGHWVPPCAIVWKTSFLRSIGGWSELANRTNDQDGELIYRSALH